MIASTSDIYLLLRDKILNFKEKSSQQKIVVTLFVLRLNASSIFVLLLVQFERIIQWNALVGRKCGTVSHGMCRMNFAQNPIVNGDTKQNRMWIVVSSCWFITLQLSLSTIVYPHRLLDFSRWMLYRFEVHALRLPVSLFSYKFNYSHPTSIRILRARELKTHISDNIYQVSVHWIIFSFVRSFVQFIFNVKLSPKLCVGATISLFFL